jgi:hypothetical protein
VAFRLLTYKAAFSSRVRRDLKRGSFDWFALNNRLDKRASVGVTREKAIQRGGGDEAKRGKPIEKREEDKL